MTHELHGEEAEARIAERCAGSSKAFTESVCPGRAHHVLALLGDILQGFDEDNVKPFIMDNDDLALIARLAELKLYELFATYVKEGYVERTVRTDDGTRCEIKTVLLKDHLNDCPEAA